MPKGRENVYTCGRCGGYTVTIDVDEGTTPFMLGCRATKGCTGTATSAFYPEGPRPPRIPAPAWEWYRPTEAEVRAKYAKEPNVMIGMLEHVRLGGLDIRPIATKAGAS